MKPLLKMVLFFVMLTASLPAFAATDGIYGLNKNLTASWDGTTASRLISVTTDYDYAYGDESAVTYTLPWSFTFYGQPYSQITADTNGNIWFGTTGSASSFNLASNGKGPVIAAWNNDLSSYFTGGVFVQHKANPERIVIEWQTETYSDEGLALPNNFEVVLFQNGDIRIDYKSFTAANAKDFGSGISSNDNAHYLSITNTFLPVYQLAGSSYGFSAHNGVFGVPDAPTGVTATAGNSLATVNFTAPAANYGGAISSYTVTSSPGMISATGTANSIIVTGLTNGTAYTFTVAATNDAGTGPASTPSNSVTPYAAYFLALTVNGSGTVHSAPITDINCTGACGLSYPSGTQVTLTAVPGNGSRLSGWTGACSGTGNCIVTMSQAQNVTALFVVDTTAPQTTPTPIMGTYGTTQNVTLTCSNASGGACATIHYCLGSGCTPTTAYSGPISIASSTILRFYSTDVAGNSEQVRTYSYTIDPAIVYRFERLWPNLTQPWYFSSPGGAAVDASGNTYIADTGNNRIQKFDSTGAYVTSWGLVGSDNGQFNHPTAITVNSTGNVYVTDNGNNRIQKFDANGTFVTAWGTSGSGTGQFNSPTGITTDLTGNIYVTDNNNRVQKFDSSGTFITAWGSAGSDNGQFSYPSGVAVDLAGNIYIADTNNNRIQKFNPTGDFVTAWGSLGNNNGQFYSPSGITVDLAGNVYVADSFNNRIQKFDSIGTFVTTWGSAGSDGGQFNFPSGITGDSSGNVYVTDTSNNRIQKFDSNGSFVTSWGSAGSDNGAFSPPSAITEDPAGNFYVADAGNNRVQKFDLTGAFVTTWGSAGSDNGQFASPSSVIVDSASNVYVADSGNNRIQKFDSIGTFVTTWGSTGSNNGQFYYPSSIAIDSAGNAYVADAGNNRIQKFDFNGVFVVSLGTYGSNNGQFDNPQGVAVDLAGNIYVADTGNNRIQKFDCNGVFVASWGSIGSGNGQFTSPTGITVDSTGNVFITDKNNNRIQKFDPSGVFVTVWGLTGTGNGQFNHPQGITVDSVGNVYVIDAGNNRIQKFNR